MIRYKQGIQTSIILLTSERSSEEMMESSTLEHTEIFPIVKILLKVKLLGLSVQAPICNQTLGKLWGIKSTQRDAVQKNEEGTPISAAITNKAEVWFVFFFQQGKSEDFYFLTEQFVHGYIRTHRKQEMIPSCQFFRVIGYTQDLTQFCTHFAAPLASKM